MNKSTKSKNKTKSNVFSSIEEWKKMYIPTNLEEEIYKNLSENPEELAKSLAEKTFQEIEIKYSL